MPTSGVNAVIVNVNVTSTAGTGPGFVTVYPCDDPRPTASNLNFDQGRDVANTATVPIGPSGTICLYANTTTDLVIDIEGWFGR